MGEITDAMARYEERQDAADISAALVSKQAAEDTFRRLLSGLDLDLEELERVNAQRFLDCNSVAAMGSGPGLIGITMFTEGIAVGLLIAEARQREEARS